MLELRHLKHDLLNKIGIAKEQRKQTKDADILSIIKGQITAYREIIGVIDAKLRGHQTSHDINELLKD